MADRDSLAGAPERIAVSVVYALPDRQVTVDLRVPPGTSVADAVTSSGLVQRFTEIASRPLACAVYGRAVALTYVLRAGDRVEILRPLLIDPKEQRRKAAAARGKAPRG
jgi:putative ubiquitin-RnfH superfamily antitoxin RatB of RatAB toxin-antitoxin module